MVIESGIKRWRGVKHWWQCLRPCPICGIYLNTNGSCYDCERCGYHDGPLHPRGVLLDFVLIDPDQVGRISPRREGGHYVAV